MVVVASMTMEGSVSIVKSDPDVAVIAAMIAAFLDCRWRNTKKVERKSLLGAVYLSQVSTSERGTNYSSVLLSYCGDLGKYP